MPVARGDLADQLRAADAAYDVFCELESRLPIRDRIERSNARYFAERRDQIAAWQVDRHDEES